MDRFTLLAPTTAILYLTPLLWVNPEAVRSLRSSPVLQGQQPISAVVMW